MLTLQPRGSAAFFCFLKILTRLDYEYSYAYERFWQINANGLYCQAKLYDLQLFFGPVPNAIFPKCKWLK